MLSFGFSTLYFHHEFYIGLSFLESVVISLYTVGEEEGPIRADAVLPELPLLLPVPAGQNIQQSHSEGYARKTVQGKSRIQGKTLMYCTCIVLLPITCSVLFHLSSYQGALYVVLGIGKRTLASKRSWEVIGQLWPAIIQAQQSEKPSILRVVDDIIAKVSKNLESPGIETRVR